jgi:hypothetical protein
MVTRWRIFAILLGLAFLPPGADACLRDTLDTRAVQWSHLIVRAKLEEPGKPVALAASPATAPAVTPEGYVISTFQVSEVLDGAAAPVSQPIRVLRLASSKAKPSNCPVSLSGKKAGESFILLLRRCDQTELAGVASGVIPEEARRDAYVLVHALGAEADAGAVADLKQMIKDVRSAEEAATDQAIGPQVDALASAADETEAEDAHKALLELGPKALPALRAKGDDSSINDTGRTRLRGVIEELAPPPLAAEQQ